MKLIVINRSSIILSAIAAAAISPCLQFQNLVSFGDSLTDKGRLNHIFLSRAPPPVGELLPPSNNTASGGQSWPRFVVQKAGVKSLNYAIGGAVCSNAITPRFIEFFGDGPMPAVLENEIPTYLADLDYELYDGGRTADNTVYSLWIGSNDLGVLGFLTDEQVPGKTLSDFVDCSWQVFDEVYKTGGRHFVLFTIFPYDQSPLYNLPSRGGLESPPSNPTKTETNTTLYYSKAQQYSTSVNTMLKYGAGFEAIIQSRWPGATLSVLDAHALMIDIIDSPNEYLEAPANTTGVYARCADQTGIDCELDNNSPESFVFYDDLHPSARMGDKLCAPSLLDAMLTSYSRDLRRGVSRRSQGNVEVRHDLHGSQVNGPDNTVWDGGMFSILRKLAFLHQSLAFPYNAHHDDGSHSSFANMIHQAM